jgi:hypothetical protein
VILSINSSQEFKESQILRVSLKMMISLDSGIVVIDFRNSFADSKDLHAIGYSKHLKQISKILITGCIKLTSISLESIVCPDNGLFAET